MGQTTIKRAIIYCRVSTKEQVEDGNSLITQEKICRDWAIKNNFEIVCVFIEEGESAKNASRPELQKMLKFCAQSHKEIDALIIYKIDRLSRNTDDYSQLRIFFSKLKIQIISTSERFDNNPVGKFVENMLANVAQFDNDVRSERCKNGMIDATKSGRYVFPAPFGYKNDLYNGEKNIVVVEKEAQIIKRIFELLYSNLYSQEEVRRLITIENPNIKISKQSFHRWIRTKTYKGIIDAFDLGEIKGTFEPIVETIIFDNVQRILDRKDKRKIGYNINNPDFPLRNLIKNELGQPLDGSWSRGNAKQKFAYYRFRNTKGFNVKKEVLEEKFDKYLKGFEFNKNFTDLLKDSIVLNWKHRNQSNNNLREQIKKEIIELKNKQEKIIDKNCSGVIKDDLAKEQLNKIQEEIVRLTVKLKDYEDVDDVGGVLDYGLNFLQNLSTEIGKLDINIRKNLQWFLFPDGITFDGEKFRTHRTASILLNKKDFSRGKVSYGGLGGIRTHDPLLAKQML